NREIMYTDEQFIEAWKRGKCSPQLVAGLLGMSVRNVYKRRAYLVSKGHRLDSVTKSATGGGSGYGWQAEESAWPQSVEETLKDGMLCVFGDAHWWGPPSLAHRAMLILLKRLRPKLVIGNGDLFDAATISRHDPMGWVKLPTVAEELDTVRLRIDEIERAAPAAKKLKTIGNHDSRMDRRLATDASEFEGVSGFRLQDHIRWPMSYVVVINRDIEPVLVMHNF